MPIGIINKFLTFTKALRISGQRRRSTDRRWRSIRLTKSLFLSERTNSCHFSKNLISIARSTWKNPPIFSKHLRMCGLFAKIHRHLARSRSVAIYRPCNPRSGLNIARQTTIRSKISIRTNKATLAGSYFVAVGVGLIRR